MTKVSIKNNNNTTYWNGSTWSTNEVYNDATGTGTWTYGNPGWVSGNTYVLTPKSYDNASNVETPADRVPASWSFTFDNIGPTSNTTFPTNGAALSSISAISGAASDLTSDISMVEVNIKNTTTTKYWTGSTWVVVENNWPDATGTANWSTWWYNITSFDEGNSYLIKTRATDVINNIETSGVLISFIYDTVKPTATITLPTNGAIAKSLPTISGIAVDNASGVKLVKLSIKNVTNTLYYTDTSWEEVKYILMFQEQIHGLILLLHGLMVRLFAQTYGIDNANNTESIGLGNSFYYDESIQFYIIGLLIMQK